MSIQNMWRLSSEFSYAAVFESVKSLTWAGRILWLAVVFLPFQQALTIEIGFPLKLTEFLGIVGLLLVAFERRGSWKRGIKGAFADWPWRLLIALGLMVLASSIWTAITTEQTDGSRAYPRGLHVDLFLYTGYAGLALVLCLALSQAFNRSMLATAVSLAVRLAFVYAVVQIIFWANDPAFLSIVGGNNQLGSLYGLKLPRNGPFLEGNYLGFFAVASGFVLVRAKDFRGAALAVMLLLYSQSTGGMLAAVAGLVAILVLRPSWRKGIIAGALALVGVGLFVIVPTVNRFILGQLTKLGLIENNFGPAYGYSLRGRSVNAETGFSMAWSNPIFGVGQGRYALHYWDYIDTTGLPSNFASQTIRPIANNVYAQLAAETGVIALTLFIALLLLLAFFARFESDGTLGLVVAISVGVIAYPAWTGLTLWVMLGIAIASIQPMTEFPKQLRRTRPDPMQLA